MANTLPQLDRKDIGSEESSIDLKLQNEATATNQTDEQIRASFSYAEERRVIRKVSGTLYHPPFVAASSQSQLFADTHSVARTGRLASPTSPHHGLLVEEPRRQQQCVNHL